MTEADWLTATDPQPMLELIRGKASDRKLRLLGCACCRRIWTIISDSITKQLLEAVEGFVDGRESAVTIGRLRKQSTRANTRYLHPYGLAERRASVESISQVLHGVAAFRSDVEKVGIWTQIIDDESTLQVALLCDIFGNPFRPIAFDPTWRTETVVALATGIYADRAFDRIPILANALQEAGCDSDDVLTHCRGDGPHARGCWVVDLVLGKE